VASGGAVAYSRPPAVEDGEAGKRVRAGRIVSRSAAADCKNGGHPTPVRWQRGITHRIDPSMHAVQTACGDASTNRFLAESQLPFLADRDHPVLPIGDSGNRGIWWGGFPGHYKG
jgi:hypothetical protein